MLTTTLFLQYGEYFFKKKLQRATPQQVAGLHVWH